MKREDELEMELDRSVNDCHDLADENRELVTRVAELESALRTIAKLL